MSTAHRYRSSDQYTDKLPGTPIQVYKVQGKNHLSFNHKCKILAYINEKDIANTIFTSNSVTKRSV